MPTQALQSQYWPGDGEEPEIVLGTPSTHYPWYFDGSYVGMGMFKVRLAVPRERYWWERYLKRVKGILVKYIWRKLPLRLFLLPVLIKLLFSDAFGHASRAIRAVAVDPTSRNLKYWPELNRLYTRQPVVGENAYRAMSAVIKLEPLTPELTRWERELVLELAYTAFKLRGR